MYEERIKQKRIIVCASTRPEMIKMIPVYLELKKRNTIDAILFSTGQHKQMLYQVCEAYGVFPDVDLGIMKERQTLFDITSSILEKAQEALNQLNPDVVLVHGDTASTFAIALACFYLKIPIGHIEAGLRTNNIYSPFPEEFYRRAVSMVSAYDFAPTQLSATNLMREGKGKDSVFITGNTVVDALQHTVKEEYFHPELDWAAGYKLIFITAHRRENIGKPMHQMFRAIRRVLDEHPECRAVYPIHMNPTVREIAKAEFEGCPRIHIIEPLDVTDCHNFEARSYLCLTDSGGIQEECPTFGVPVLVMRKETERPEGVSAGAVRLVGTEEEEIYTIFSTLLDDKAEYDRMSKAKNPFGDGRASVRIANILEGKGYQPWNP